MKRNNLYDIFQIFAEETAHNPFGITCSKSTFTKLKMEEIKREGKAWIKK